MIFRRHNQAPPIGVEQAVKMMIGNLSEMDRTYIRSLDKRGLEEFIASWGTRIWEEYEIKPRLFINNFTTSIDVASYIIRRVWNQLNGRKGE